MVTLERVIKAEDKKEKIDPSSILPQLSDMLNILGNAIFLTSLKRRDELILIKAFSQCVQNLPR